MILQKRLIIFLGLFLAFAGSKNILANLVATGSEPVDIHENINAEKLFDQTCILSHPEYREALNILGFPDSQLPMLMGEKIPLKKLSFEQAENIIGQACGEEYLRQWKNVHNNALSVILKKFAREKAFLNSGIFPLYFGTNCLFNNMIEDTTNFLRRARGEEEYNSFNNIGNFSKLAARITCKYLVLCLFVNTVQYRFYLTSDIRYERDNPSKDFFYNYMIDYSVKKLALNATDMVNDIKEQKVIPAEEFFCGLIKKPAVKKQTADTLKIKKLLSLPIKSKKPKLKEQALIKDLNLYGEEAIDSIIYSCINHESAYRQQYGTNPQSREFLNLVSTPGTGKSYLVEAIGKGLGLPTATICLSGITKEKLEGDENNPGLFVEKLIELGSRNGILFFDELDRVTSNPELLSIILPILDPNVKVFYSQYFNRHIDVSHLFIISAGNANFKDAALRSRFHNLKTIDMSIVNKELLLDIVMKSYLPKKLNTGEIAPDFREKVSVYLTSLTEKDEPLSFRDAQAKIDELLAANRRELRFGKREKKQS